MMAQRQTGVPARAAGFLLISALAALAAVAIVWRVIQSYQDQLTQVSAPEPTVPVIVAARTLYQGQTIAPEDVKEVQVPPAFVPDTVFHNIDDVQGRVPRERVIAGEYVRKERLAGIENGLGLNAIIPRGKRAISINITDGSAVSGFLNPGNYVDILVTLQDTTAREKQVRKTITLLQAIQVLAVNSRLGSAEDEREEGQDGIRHQPSVTLALTPEEVTRLAHANAEGAVTLTLRNDIDVTQQKTNPVHANTLIGRVEKPAVPVAPVKKAPPKPEPKPVDGTIEIIKGTQKGTEKVNKQDGSTKLH
jgi:pilus assembly protein CpaB